MRSSGWRSLAGRVWPRPKHRGRPLNCIVRLHSRTIVARYEIPIHIVDRDGPFSEFKQNAAMVSVKLTDGRTIGQVLLVYPNEVWAVQGSDRIPFDPAQVERVFQAPRDLEIRTTSDWVFFGATNAP